MINEFGYRWNVLYSNSILIQHSDLNMIAVKYANGCGFENHIKIEETARHQHNQAKFILRGFCSRSNSLLPRVIRYLEVTAP